jgi:DNA-binding transcriptional ArsR family regulator
MLADNNSSQDDGKVFKALADNKRRMILDILKIKPRTTGEICAYFKGLDRCTVMMHLEILRRAELIISKKEGRFRWNYLDAIPIKRIHDRWIGQYANYAVEMLQRLKENAEGTELDRSES